MSDEVGELIGLGIGLAAIGVGTGILMKSIGDATDEKKVVKKKKKCNDAFKGLF
jgi:hypothetical protein